MSFSRQRLLDSNQYSLVLSVLHSHRKSRTDYQQATDEDYLSDVVNSLHIAGFCIVPCGALDSIKIAIDKIFGKKPEAKAAKK